MMEASSISVCLDGGWGVDALLGEQTREHGDLDVILNDGDLSRLAEATRSYPRKPDGTDTNFVLEMGPGNEVDVHAIPFDGRGFGVFALPDGRKWPFPPAAFQGRGTIQGKAVRCLSPDAQVQCHGQGYAPDEDDLRDGSRTASVSCCRSPSVHKPD